jgi:hypothetical protein
MNDEYFDPAGGVKFVFFYFVTGSHVFIPEGNLCL